MKNILTLTDFSTVAENAVESAFIFANKYGCHLTIFHNSQKGELAKYHMNTAGLTNLNSIENTDNINLAPINKWKYWAQKHQVNSTIVIGSGKIKDNVEQITKNQKIDLVIMGSTGAGGKDEYIWGSNTEKVIDEIDCPVLVIKRPMSDYRIDNIVFASSFDTNEQEVFQYALNLLSPPKDCVIHLLSIDTLSYFTQPTVVMKEAMKNYETLAKPYKAISHFYKDYSIDSGIRHFLEEVQPDILIMSNKNTNPLKKFIKGSNTTRAVNHADFPVLTIDYK